MTVLGNKPLLPAVDGGPHALPVPTHTDGAAASRMGGGESTQVLAVALCAVVAFHFSLASLMQGIAADESFALVALIPPGALALALALARPRPGEPAIHDQQLDWIVGLPLLGAALALGFWWPAWGSSSSWASRTDLAVLPVFVAGAVAVLAGTRVLWRIRTALALLLLAWIGLLRPLLGGTLGGLTRWFVPLVNASRPDLAASTDGPLLIVALGADRLALAAATYVLTALLGFLVFGVAVAVRLRGPRARKLLWLGAGGVLAAELSIAEVLIVAGVGLARTPAIAPFIGVTSATVSFAVMLAGLRAFGLERPASSWRMARLRRPRALAVVGVAAALLAIANRDLAPVASLSTPLGGPRVAAFSAAAAAPPGWRLAASRPGADPYGRVEEYLGNGAIWQRHRYLEAQAGAPVTADTVATPRAGALDALGVDRVYTLAGATLRGREQVRLGPVSATLEAFDDPSRQATWSLVHWTWRVRARAGASDERVTLTSRLPLHATPQSVGAEHERLTRLGRQLIAARLASSGLANGTDNPREVL